VARYQLPSVVEVVGGFGRYKKAGDQRAVVWLYNWLINRAEQLTRAVKEEENYVRVAGGRGD
jgi:predicted trehalose synthase